MVRRGAHLYRLPPQHYEALCPLHHEASKLVTQYALYFIGLLDFDTQTNGID